MVIPEYRSGNGRADYALMNNGSPAMMVEAKSLGTPLQDTVLSQGINYCLMEGTSYFSVTDGRLWEIYETHKPVPINDKRIVRFDLKGDPAQACLKALALWRPGVESGDISTAQTPVVEPTQPQQDIPRTVVQPTPTPTVQSESVIPKPEIGKWQSLSEFNPEKDSPLPDEIQFPDGTRKQTPLLRATIIEVARWLIDNEKLTPNHCPVQLSYARNRYVVNTEPYHQSGKQFSNPEKIGSLYIHTHGNRFGIFRRARELIKHLGQDPSQFKVRLP